MVGAGVIAAVANALARRPFPVISGASERIDLGDADVRPVRATPGDRHVTCFTPSVTERGHAHFVDGAGGGYTMAAMKVRRDALASDGRSSEGGSPMHSILRSLAPVAAAGLMAAFAGQRTQADVPTAQPVALAILNLDYVDTSGEPVDQAAAHQRRAAAFVSDLRRDLAANGQYRIVPISCGSAPCESEMNPAEIQKAAHAAGAKLVLIGGVHKMSTLVQWAKFQIADEEQGRVVFDRLLTFRGDTDEAWQKAESFVARDILQSAPRFGKNAGAIAPVKLAIFDFELEDFSGGAGIIPESADDSEQLRLATETARRLIAESGRYSLVDVSNANAAAVKTHILRQCDGCEAGIARELGADQSLVGIVNRVSRMEYGVTYQLRDATTGKLLSVVRTDLRIGANYSWSRGAAWLVKNQFLEKQTEQAHTP